MTDEQLTHLDERGAARMVDVGGKQVTRRRAVAHAVLRLRPDTAALLATGGLPKGDAVAVARIAGIMAAKRTPELIPLCHPVRLASVAVDVEVEASDGSVEVTAVVEAADRTGVEMEALVAASTAALALYDMVKALDRGAVVERVELLAKSGGTRGPWRREGS